MPKPPQTRFKDIARRLRRSRPASSKRWLGRPGATSESEYGFLGVHTAPGANDEVELVNHVGFPQTRQHGLKSLPCDRRYDLRMWQHCAAGSVG